MIRALALVLIGLSLLTASCRADKTWKEKNFTELKRPLGSNDVELPTELWAKLVDVLHDRGSESQDEATTSDKRPAQVQTLALPTEFAGLTLYLIEKTPGILKHGDTKIELGGGGGEIDLRDFVERRNGSFSLQIEFLNGEGSAPEKVFFLSDSISRKRGEENLGTGCNKYYDITTAFARSMRENGFLLNTMDGAHASALTGTFFFAAKQNEKLHLAQLTIKDSNHRSIQCRR